MKKWIKFLPLVIVFGMPFLITDCKTQKDNEMYVGSLSCIQCHERFYQLWANSHHGTAMQGIDSVFIASELTFDNASAQIGDYSFTAFTRNDSLLMLEKANGKVKEYPAIHALGGKYIFYFLTPFENGRLQVLPLAYDLKSSEWYNTPASAVRHFVDPIDDEELDWHSFAYTFNTSCHSCHVSQLRNNYDPITDKYSTTWKEAGINCETCHGPCQGHVEVCQKAKKGEVPEDLKIIITKKYTHEEHNSSCAPCHAKMRTLTLSYPPGEKFFDHFDLVTLEDPDFYPDGRDLGENYTYTTWKQGACAQSGMLDCVMCHTSSGRYRFATENQNGACMPCHEDKVKDISAHSHHPEGTKGLVCISCHMPKTSFARMNRSDHSLRPPMPAATIAFGSPNACNLCHTDETPEWANKWVTKWNGGDYQNKTLMKGRLLLDARSGQWKYLDEILTGLYNNSFDEVYTNSFLRLLATLENDNKWPAILVQAGNPSPLVRSSAINLLGQIPSVETKNILLQASHDPYRVVRRAVASSVANFPQGGFSTAEMDMLKPLMTEYEKAFLARPDDWAAHYNLGNYYQNQHRLEEAIAAYEKSIELFPEAIAPLINQSFAYNLLGKKEMALNRLYRALEIDPENEATNLNFAMLMAEMGRMEEAETAMRKVLEINPKSTQAAYNLGIMLAETDPVESLEFCRQAMDDDPSQPKYTYTYAFYMNKAGHSDQSHSLLEQVTNDYPDYTDAWLLLGSIFEQEDDSVAAKSVYKEALQKGQFGEEDQARLKQKISTMK
ncbi:MAG: ammonia-forming cytochrome c nitrite reductase subunit c552 [Bacteroidales bacterium]|nr:ammonia-forming cytochrome c nitrite reductase subunit c552 [Bacteroidales bacterium]